MRTAATIALLLGSFSIAAADEEPPASAPDESPVPVLAPAAEPAPPIVTTPAVINVEAKATKRPGSVLHIPAPTQGQYAVKPNVSKTPALIATAATGVLLGASILSYRHFNSINNSGHGETVATSASLMERDRRIESADRWMKISLGMFASTVISSGITGYLWSRRENPGPAVNLEPTNKGVMFQYYRPIR